MYEKFRDQMYAANDLDKVYGIYDRANAAYRDGLLTTIEICGLSMLCDDRCREIEFQLSFLN
jgi:hypothetical protein